MARQIHDNDWGSRLARWRLAVDEHWKARLETACLRATRFLVWAYVVVVAALWCTTHFVADLWWPVSLALFGPRWLGLVPGFVLIPLALVVRPRLLVPVFVALLLFLFCVMGYCLPQVWDSRRASDGVRVVCCNVHGGTGGWDRVHRLLLEESPDIVALQEMSGSPEGVFPETWFVTRDSEYLIGSQFPIEDTRVFVPDESTGLPRRSLAIYTLLKTPSRSIGVCNLHPTSPHDGLEAVLDRTTLVDLQGAGLLKKLNEQRRLESEALAAWIRTLPQVDLVVGDFNLPVESRIYKQNWGGFRNAFSDAGFGLGYTRWQKIHNFSYGVRIDHILTTDAWRTADCYVGRDIGSDHLPVVAEVYWNGAVED